MPSGCFDGSILGARSVAAESLSQKDRRPGKSLGSLRRGPPEFSRPRRARWSVLQPSVQGSEIQAPREPAAAIRKCPAEEAESLGAEEAEVVGWPNTLRIPQGVAPGAVAAIDGDQMWRLLR